MGSVFRSEQRVHRAAGLALALAWLVQGLVALFFSLPSLFRLLAAGPEISPALMGAVGVVLAIEVILGALMLWTSFGVVRRRAWSVWLGVLLCAVQLFSFPVGTVIALVTGGLVLYLRQAGYFTNRAPDADVTNAA